MLAFFINVILAFSEGGGHGDGFYGKVEPYLNYPGFEFWRFLNLTIFALLMVFLLKKPLSKAFKEKRESIREDLIRAEEEKKIATAKLHEAESKLSRIEEEQRIVIEGAKAEAAAEKERIAREAELEIRRAHEQAEIGLARKAAQANAQLKRFAAQESVRLAEEKIKNSMDAAKDADLIKTNIASIGGISR